MGVYFYNNAFMIWFILSFLIWSIIKKMKKEKIKNSSIIGYSGTIEKTLCDKVNFTCRYNSKNIEK